MGKVLIFISNASQKVGMREIGVGVKRGRRLALSRTVTCTWFRVGSSYTSFKITVFILCNLKEKQYY